MHIVKGDLIHLALTGRFDVIIHGCNCFCTMDAGIARQIRTLFPEAFAADCATIPGDKIKLGTITTVTVRPRNRSLTVVNAYTQFHYAGSGVLVDYPAVESVFKAVKTTFSGQKIAYPKIGAGLARGSWEKIASIIDGQLAGEDHTLVEYSQTES